MRAIFQYRATCFGRPIAPWREDKRAVCRDLIAHELGGWDQWGKFFITVPGDVEKREIRIPLAIAAA